MTQLLPGSTARWGPATEPPPTSPRPSVAVVITTYNHAHFLPGAIESVLAQSERPRDILVVDDGSTDDPASMVAAYPDVRLVRQENQGLAAARNAGLAAVTSDKVIFLDADDLLLPRAVEAGLDCFERTPDAGLVYGGHRRVDPSGRALGQDRYAAVGPEAYRDLLKGNVIGMHATVMYDRQRLSAAGGFDRTLRRCEDYDLFLRMSRVAAVASHPEVVAEYRWHGGNMSSDHRDMLAWVLLVHDRQKPHAFTRAQTREDWHRGRRIWRDYYAGEILKQAAQEWRDRKSSSAAVGTIGRAALASPLLTASWGFGALCRRIARILPPRIRRWIGGIQGKPSVPQVGAVTFGDLNRVTPISDDFGFDRGTPIDRYYVEGFLQRHADDIGGRALEIGDDSYCRRFGAGRIRRQDVLHVSPTAPAATIVGDLSQKGVLPPDTFDCLVITQTLHLIFDMRAAVVEMHGALKPGGVLLLTVPGISRIDRGEWRDSWFWSLTRGSARRLFTEVFGAGHVEVEAFGNVFAATAFLHGVALEEIDASKLDVTDESYPVIVAVRAQRSMEP